MSKLHTQNTSSSQQQILNPQDYVPPKSKPSVHSQPSSHSTPQRLKFKYTYIQKPHRSVLGKIFIVLWFITMFGLFYVSYCQKMDQLLLKTSQEQIKCREEYEKNKCQRGLKATQNFCEEMKKCYESQEKQAVLKRVRIAEMVGEILKNFVQGAGIYVCICGLAMIWVLAKRESSKQIRKQYCEYC